MPVHMRYNISDHIILANGPESRHGHQGSILILQDGRGCPLTGLFEKTVLLNNILVREDSEEPRPIKFNRGSIIDYLVAQEKVDERRFTFGAKGLFGIGLFGTGLSDQEIQRLFNECVGGEKRVSRPSLGRGGASNELPPIDPSDIRAPRGVRGALAQFAADFKIHISAFDPRPGVREARPLFTGEDKTFESIETYTRSGKKTATDVIVHVRVPGDMPSAVVFWAWYIRLENKLKHDDIGIEEIVVYPTAIDNPNSVDAVWAEIATACKAAHSV